MNFGIIGLGHHALTRVMPAIVKTDNDIIAVYSRSIKKAITVGKEYSAKGYSDLDLFFNQDFDAVYIASPNFLHYTHAKTALINGKNVLLEKPMTLNPEHALELVNLANDNKLTLAIGFHMRFHPALETIKTMIKHKKLGKLIYISGAWSWRATASPVDPDRSWWYEPDKVGGGPVMATGVHVLDLLNYILDRSPDSIFAVRVPHREIIETTEFITMQYDSIITTVLASRAILNPDNSIIINGTDGTIIGKDIMSTTVSGKLIILTDTKTEIPYTAGNLYEYEIMDFTHNKFRKIAHGYDGYVTVKIVHTAYKSDLAQKSINLDLSS